MGRQSWLFSPRLPGRREYLAALDDSVRTAVTGEKLPQVALSDAAEVSLDAQYYIWNADTTGRLLADRLLRAAERGVRVRLLLDDYGIGSKDNELFALDTHSNIEVRVYNPFNAGFRSGLRRWTSLFVGSRAAGRRSCGGND